MPYLLAHQLSTTVAQVVVGSARALPSIVRKLKCDCLAAILCLRTYALYGRSKRILTVLVAAGLAGVAASAVRLCACRHELGY
jgi:hypothetical protein